MNSNIEQQQRFFKSLESLQKGVFMPRYTISGILNMQSKQLTFFKTVRKFYFASAQRV